MTKRRGPKKPIAAGDLFERAAAGAAPNNAAASGPPEPVPTIPLPPCPFCGGQAWLHTELGRVVCHGCRAQGPAFEPHGNSLRAKAQAFGRAADAWRRRSTDAPTPGPHQVAVPRELLLEVDEAFELMLSREEGGRGAGQVCMRNQFAGTTTCTCSRCELAKQLAPYLTTTPAPKDPTP